MLIAAIAIITLSQVYYSSEREAGAVLPGYALFESESEYISHVENEVRFDGVSFDIVKVKPRDNFWKIAKRSNVNIDTLIAANPYWEHLLARADQRVVVPSTVGVLLFVKNMEDVSSVSGLYEVNSGDILMQKMTAMEKFERRIGKKTGPIALFLKGVRPERSMMTANLAKKYTVREMFRSPLGGRFSSYFGRRADPFNGSREFHNGLDIATKYGTPVGSAAAGRVIAAGWMGGYGKAVMVQHEDGYRTLYGHLSSIAVRSGTKIKAGQFVGRVGSTGYSTGPHLHFTLWKNGRSLNPLDVLW